MNHDDAIPIGIAAAAALANMEVGDNRFRDDTGRPLFVGERVQIMHHTSLMGCYAEVVGLDLFDRDDDRTLGENLIYVRIEYPDTYVKENPVEAQALLPIHPACVRYVRRRKK